MNFAGLRPSAVVISLALSLTSVLLVGSDWLTVSAHDEQRDHPGKDRNHGGGGGGHDLPGLDPLGPTPCAGGFAGPYPCARVDLLSFVPISTIGGGRSNDIWGWTDPLTGREYALVGRTTGTSFVDVSDPEAPRYLGNLPPHTAASIWRGIKVYADHAFIVSEASGHGMQIFDLTQLRTVVTPPVTFSETTHYAGISTTHTLAINDETGFAYAAGTNTCAGGLHMIDVRNPAIPTFAGCFSGDGYTHETQCAVYHGPDATFTGREICFNSNIDTLTIVDVTNKAAPVMLSRKKYAGRGYAHQGWLTEDHRHFLLDDEKDETSLKTNTRTHVWDVSNLTVPRVIGVYEGASTAIDHNLYVLGSHAFEANYRSGLRVLDIAAIESATLREIGFFDVHPHDDLPVYSGAWSNFPFFASGIVVISSIERGLFVVRPNLSPITGPDVILSALSAPPVGGPGQILSITDTTENQGGAFAPASVTRFHFSTDERVDDGDDFLGLRNVESLESGVRNGATTTVTIPTTAPAGGYYIIGVSDAESHAAEEIENNNARPRFIRIGPDLRITAYRVPATSDAGSAMTVTHTTANDGGAIAESTITRFFLSRNGKIDAGDVELGNEVIPTLNPGERHSAMTVLDIPPAVSPGAYYVIVHADRDNALNEFTESNNVASRKITVR